MGEDHRTTLRLRRPARILLVEDDPPTRERLVPILCDAGHTVASAPSAESALEALETASFDALVSKLSLPRLGVAELMRRAHARDHDLPVVLLSDEPTLPATARALAQDTDAYLALRPSSQLLASVARAVRMGQIARAKRDAVERAAVAGPKPDIAPESLRERFDGALSTLGVAYQPIVGRMGTPFGFEALMRTTEPSLPSPESVLDAAEALGRLDVLGRRVRSLAPLPFEGTSGVLFVNLHPRDLLDDELLQPGTTLAAMSTRVVLELTERCSLAKVPGVRERVADLRARGFRVAVDDLGAGAAGLEALVLIEPEFVKLDIGLIRGVDASVPKQRLVQSLTEAGKDLGMTIVAEGIETRGELDCVVELGCDLFQGFLLGRPGPPLPQASWPS